MQTFSEAFQREAVAFFSYSGNTLEDASRLLGVDPSMLLSWVQIHGTQTDLLSGVEKETISGLVSSGYHDTQTLQVDVETLEGDFDFHHKDTLRHTFVGQGQDSFFRTWLAEDKTTEQDSNTLDSSSSIPSLDSDFPLSSRGNILGQGGMGQVISGVQASMGREIAVKEIRPDRVNPKIIKALLQEAWITGFLEHPNIIPIYTIDKNEHDQPMILMKKIEGKSWGQYLHHPDAVTEQFQVSDILVWHLQIFQQVCAAIEFAHSKGFLHRDIKPENVMIGVYGEVYVVDWGIAVALDKRYHSWIPTVHQVRSMAGTPAYMAPEMAEVQGDRLSPQSDIYLLGAMLYEIVQGTPPHAHVSLENLSTHIQNFQPKFTDTVHPELQTIVQKCMHVVPQERYSSVQALRTDIASFLEYRQLHGVLDGLLEEIDAVQKSIAENKDRNTIYAHFFAARFALQQLAGCDMAWSDHPKRYAQAVHQLINWELSAKRYESAELLLDNLPSVPSSIIEEIVQLKQEFIAEQKRIREMDIMNSETIGIRTRSFVIIWAVVGWVVFPIWCIVSHVEYTYTHLHIQTAGMFVWMLAIGVWAKDSLSRTDLNRRVYSILLAEPLLHLVSDVCAWAIDWTPSQAWMMRFIVWNTMMLSYAMLSESRFLILALGYSLLTVLAFSQPQYIYHITVLVNLALLLGMGILWRDSLKQAEDARQIERSKK